MSKAAGSLILALVVVIAAWTIWHRMQEETVIAEQDDGITVVRPRTPILPGSDVLFADSVGNVDRVRVDDARHVDATITVAMAPDSSLGAVQLLVRIRPAHGLFPELRGRLQEISAQALSGGNLVTLTHQPRPIFAVEARPYVGGMLSGRVSPITGLSVARIGPLHISGAVGLGGHGQRRLEVYGLVSTALLGPMSLAAGVRLLPEPAPSIGILIPF